MFYIWGLRLGSVRPNSLPSLYCLPHWKNTGSLSSPDLGMLATMSKGEMWRGDIGYRERG